MNSNSVGSFFAELRRKLFKFKVDHEIDDCIAAHLQREKDCGYPFETREQMSAQTEEFNAHETLAHIEKQIQRMPKAYGQAFRYVLHRELSQQLGQYADLADRRGRPDQIDPRLVATRA